MMAEVDALDAVLPILEAGTPIYRSDLSSDRRIALHQHFLLTNKPVLAVLNIGEDQLQSADSIAANVEAELPGVEILPICVQLEAEAALLDVNERSELLEGLGLGEGALPRFVRSAYHALGLRTFLTTGEKESRAWTFRSGSTAPQCAGRIHTDFERGFIRAEVIRWDRLLELGSWSAARDAGRLRLEGKDYIADDGDVMEFRFNV
jgi:hypothetical protein